MVPTRKSTRKILVTGATGAVGPRVVAALHEAGYEVRTLSADPPRAGQFPDDNIEIRSGDITKSADVEAALQGVDAVVHMAALLHIIDPPPEIEQKYRQVNVGGTEVVARAALQADVKRVVFFSTIAVYGDSGGQILDEKSPANPSTFYEQTKLDAERIILDLKDETGRPLGTVLRFAAIYGPQVKGNYRKLVRALDRKRFIPIGTGLNRRTLVYDKDVARAALLALEHPDAAGKVFNVSDGEFHTLDEIIRTICRSLDRRPPGLSLPAALVRPLVGAAEFMAKICSFKPPVTRSSLDKYTEDIAVDGSRIQKELGFSPRYDLAAGWSETVKEMRELGIVRP